MKKFLGIFFKTPIILVILAISVFFGVPALADKSQANEFNVSVGVGIDLSENEDSKYEVSFLSFVPTANQSFTENYNVMSAKANTISEAVNMVGLYVGRKFRFAHIKTIVLAEEVLNENVSEILDYFIRENDIAASTKIVTTNSTAKEFMNVVQKITSQSSVKISEILSFNSDDLYALEATIESFFESTLGPTKCAILPKLDLANKEVEGLKSFSNESSGQNESSSSDGQEENKQLVNTGEVIVLKDDKKLVEMTGEQTRNINFLKGSFNTGFFDVENISGSHFSDACLVFEVFGAKMKRLVTFENGVPIVSLNLQIVVEPIEIKNSDGVYQKNVEFHSLDEEEICCVETGIKSYIGQALDFEREYNVDLADFYTIISNANQKLFQTFLSGLQDTGEYLDNIIVRADVKLKIR